MAEEEVCEGCNSTSILNKEVSQIAQPICQDECPTNVGCPDIINTQCIIYNGSLLSCLNIPTGATLNTLLAAIESLCEATANPSNCKAKISSNDTCCGYLEDKITSSSLNITTQNDGSCESITIEEKCWTWTNIGACCSSNDGTYKDGWSNQGTSTQIGQFSNVKECIVKLRGVAKKRFTSPVTQSILFTLPTGKRPLQQRYFFINAAVTGGYFMLLLIVDPSGDVSINNSQSVPSPIPSPFNSNVIVSLEGIQFEIN